MSFGETLRTAREAKGLTAKQLAETTHLLVQVVEGLENEDFRRIPAAIYGRGFVKLYCETVGLDPKPLQTEFMALYSANKDAPAKMPKPAAPERPPQIEPTPDVAAAAEQTAADAPQTAESEHQAKPTAEPSLFSQPQQVSASALSAPSPERLPQVQETAPSRAAAEMPPRTSPMNKAAPPRRSYGDIFGQSYAAEEPKKPSAAEKFRETMSNVSAGVFSNVKKLPPNTGRIATVAVASIVVIVMIGWGIAALYRATTPQQSADASPATSAEETARDTKAKPASADKDAVDGGNEAKKTSAGNKISAKKSADASVKQPSKQSNGNIKPIKPGDLKSSGIEVPDLYID